MAIVSCHHLYSIVRGQHIVCEQHCLWPKFSLIIIICAQHYPWSAFSLANIVSGLHLMPVYSRTLPHQRPTLSEASLISALHPSWSSVARLVRPLSSAAIVRDQHCPRPASSNTKGPSSRVTHSAKTRSVNSVSSTLSSPPAHRLTSTSGVPACWRWRRRTE